MREQPSRLLLFVSRIAVLWHVNGERYSQRLHSASPVINPFRRCTVLNGRTQDRGSVGSDTSTQLFRPIARAKRREAIIAIIALNCRFDIVGVSRRLTPGELRQAFVRPMRPYSYP
jgi:hypothetical protein